MITIHINGEEKELEGPLTISELIEKIQVPVQAIAVAVNSEIVPRSEFSRIRVRNRDQIEIIRAVGGG